MPAFVIFVEGADTEPAKMPVYFVESEEHASLICEGMKESDYQIFDFSFKQCTRSDRGKFAVWATMIFDAREGVYGNIVGGIYNMIDGAYSVMSGRRSREKIASGENTENGGQNSDPICAALSGQPLTLYEFLDSRTHFTSFNSLADLPGCWRKPNPQSDETVLRGLRRLRDELNDIDAAPALIIDKKHRRTKLDKPKPK